MAELRVVDVTTEEEEGGGSGNPGASYACVVGIFPTNLAFKVEIRRADDLAGAANIATILVLDSEIRPTERLYLDRVAPNAGPFHYATRHVPGGEWSCWRGPTSPVALTGRETINPVMPKPREQTSSTTTLGTLTLRVDDIQCRLVQVRMKSRVGTGVETAYAVVVIAGGVYVGTVALVNGVGSTITYELTFYNENGQLSVTEHVVYFSTGMSGEQTFTTADDETATLPNSYQWQDGENTVVTRDETVGAKKIQIDVDADGIGGGIADGRPGNFVHDFIAAPPTIVRAIDAALREPKAAKRGRFYWNPQFAVKARLEGSVHVAASAGTEIHLITVAADEVTLAETGVVMRCDRVNYPEPGALLAFDGAALGDNVRFSWGVKGGSGTDVLAVGNLRVTFLSSEDAPDAPDGDPPDDSDFGNLIHHLDADQALTQYGADGAASTWEDQTATNQDAVVSPSHGQSAPLVRATAFPGGRACVEYNGGTHGHRIGGQITSDSFTTYLHATIQSISGFAPFFAAGDGYPFGKGVWWGNSADMLGAHVNTTFWGNTFAWVADTWGRSGEHVYRFVFNRPTGRWRMYVDGVLVMEMSCNPQLTESFFTYLGYVSGEGALGMRLRREKTWDRAHETSGLNALETAILAG